MAADRSPEQIRQSLAKAKIARLNKHVAKAVAKAAELKEKAAVAEDALRNPQPPPARLVLANGNPKFRGNQDKSGTPGGPVAAFTPVPAQAPELVTQALANAEPAMPAPAQAQAAA